MKLIPGGAQIKMASESCWKLRLFPRIPFSICRQQTICIFIEIVIIHIIPQNTTGFAKLWPGPASVALSGALRPGFEVGKLVNSPDHELLWHYSSTLVSVRVTVVWFYFMLLFRVCDKNETSPAKNK